MDRTIEIWKVFAWSSYRHFTTPIGGHFTSFFPLLFIFFVIVNIAFYWWAMITAFSLFTQRTLLPGSISGWVLGGFV